MGGDALRRKLRKLREDPDRFLSDSRYGHLQTLGRVLKALRPAASRSGPPPYEVDARGTPLLADLPQPDLGVDLSQVRVSIVLPVYDGGPHLRRCVQSVLTYTRMPQVELLVIDDGSTDAETLELLERCRRIPWATVLVNDTNNGFTPSVNRGVDHAGDRDVVLLNSDTIVTPRWLENLALVALSNADVATATALSDNAGAFSTPEPGVNRTHEHFAPWEAARLSQRAARRGSHEVPTGNGFCLYLRRSAIDAVGPFDEEKYPRGYGEENDWCMRAGDLGYRHLIALRSYVHHVNAASFGADSKAALVRAARAVVEGDHPDYRWRVRKAFEGGALEEQRRSLRREWLAKRDTPASVRPRALYVVPKVTGGTPHTNRDLMRGVSDVYDPLLLVSDSRSLELFDYSCAPPALLAEHTLREPIRIVPHRSAEYDAVVASWMAAHAVEILHVRHLAWHGFGLVRAARRLGIPVVFSFHDFFAVCPSVTLTNGVDRYCRDGVTKPHVTSPLWARQDPDGVRALQGVDAGAFLRAWRRRIETVLADCDAYVTTSESTRAILVENHPILAERSDRFHVVPHGRDFDGFLPPSPAPRPDEPLKVLIPGNLSETKGRHTIIELLELDKRRRALELHTLGNDRWLRGRVTRHGPYGRSEFSSKVAGIRPHVGLVGSIWPETYCHTLTECWSSGLPVVGSELGAVGERIESSGAGWLFDSLDPRGLYDLLLRIRAGEASWADRAEAVVRWQQTEGTQNTVAAMTSQYLDIYREARARSRPRAAHAAVTSPLGERVALVASGHHPGTRATVHVRIATHVHQASGELAYEWVSAEELLATDLTDYRGVVVCRNAASQRALCDLARRCRLDRVPIVLDLDDDLLDVPPEKDPRGVYRGARSSILDLLAAASLTTVSTAPLASRYRELTRELRVVPNRLDPRVWATDIDEVERPEGLDLQAKLRVLYMGSATHDEDLELVLPAFEHLRRSHQVRLHTVGVTRTPPKGVVPLAAPDDRYDRFARWMRGVSGFFDIAIAPLVDSPFNRSKSGLKFMEYAICGLPVVASRVDAYAGIVRDGIDGLLVDDDPEAWLASLSRLAEDDDLRRRIGSAAKERAESEFIARGCVFDELPWAAWSAELDVP